MEANIVLNKLFEMRDVTHLAHLQTTNYNEHKVLNEFYDSIIDLADEFAEQYQGATGMIITNIGPISAKEGVIAKNYLKECNDFFTDVRSKCKYNNIGATLDVILQTINKTNYLLTLV